MPRTKNQITGNKPLPAKKQKGEKVCSCCGREKKVTDFYFSSSPMYSVDQRVPICKDCCKTSVLNNDGTINFERFRNLLMHIDKPLYFDLMWSSEESVKKENSYLSSEDLAHRGKEILQKYFTLVALPQDRSKSYAFSEGEGFIHLNSNRSSDEKAAIKRRYERYINDNNKEYSNISSEDEFVNNNNDDFILTEEIKTLFGEGYNISEYKKMHRKYEKLKLNYSLQTNLHQEALATYVRFKVKEEDATAKGNVDEAKKWYDAAQNAAEKAKLTPKQLSQADLHGGINSFSEIFKAVEQAVDIIPILPKFKFRPNDALDFNIWCYINYARDLQGLPQCSYEDVYKFYDKKKAEYLDQYGDPYGIFDDEPTEKNRTNVEKFITLPKDYTEGDD